MIPERTRRRFFQFSLGNLLWLTFGVFIGFAPLKVWELTHPPADQVMVSLELVEVPVESELATMGSQAVRGTGEVQDKLELLQRAGQAKRLAAPTLVTMNNHAASMWVGGELPVAVPQQDGSELVEYKDVGTKVLVVPSIQRNGLIHLKLDAVITEADFGQVKPPLNLPAFKKTQYGGEVELQKGQTMTLSSPIQKNGRIVVLMTRAELLEK